MNQLNLIIEQHYVASSSADRTYSKKGERGGSVGVFCQFIPQSKFSRFFIYIDYNSINGSSHWGNGLTGLIEINKSIGINYFSR